MRHVFGMDNDPDGILVVLPNWVGDLVMATPTLRVLRDRYPRTRIVFVCRRNLLPLLEGGDWMDEVLTWPDRGAWEMASLAGSIRRRRLDRALLLPNSMRSALLVTLAGIHRRIGYARQGRRWLLTDRLHVPRDGRRYRPHPLVEYYARLAVAAGCPPPGDSMELFTTPAADARLAHRLHTEGVPPGRLLVVISPGASFGPSKCWPPERFAAVGDLVANEFDARIVITCGPGEQSVARRVSRFMHGPHVLLERPLLSLAEFKALIKRCDLVINNDTGPRHLAKAFGVPVVTVFGSTDPRWTDTSHECEAKVSISVDCGPCQKKICPLDHRCMTGIAADVVCNEARRLLAARLAARPAAMTPTNSRPAPSVASSASLHGKTRHAVAPGRPHPTTPDAPTIDAVERPPQQCARS